MKIISWNVNGLRSVYKKGFLDWFNKINPDFLCLQETKAQPDQLPWDLKQINHYFSSFSSAKKKGYSGVAVYSREKPKNIKYKLGHSRFDQEGRILIIEYSHFWLINIYLPHGGRDKANLNYKLRVYQRLINYLGGHKSKKIVLIGDFNVAHQEIDLARPKDNKNNIMFTTEERIQIKQIINLGFSDTYRNFHQKGGAYTWWPYYSNARERNLGWRIDYAFSSKSLTPKIKDAFILSKVTGSDHCPIGIQMSIQ